MPAAAREEAGVKEPGVKVLHCNIFISDLCQCRTCYALNSLAFFTTMQRGTIFCTRTILPTPLLANLDHPRRAHPQGRPGQCVGLGVAVLRYPHQRGLVKAGKQRGHQVVEAVEGDNKSAK